MVVRTRSPSTICLGLAQGLNSNGLGARHSVRQYSVEYCVVFPEPVGTSRAIPPQMWPYKKVHALLRPSLLVLYCMECMEEYLPSRA